MKKPILLLSMMLLVSIIPGYCQEDDDILTSKKGVPILPQEHQFAIGFDASPIFEYVGNLMNLDGYNTLYMSMINNGLYGKFMISSSTAVRLKLMVNSGSGKMSNEVPDDDNTSETVSDYMDYTSSNFQITPGFEKRKSFGRMQVSFGGEAIYMLSKSKYDYRYGNTMTSDNYYPYTTLSFTSGAYYRVDNRTLSSNNGKTTSIGIRAFTGIEYFILPKISLGTEIGLRYLRTSTGPSSSTSEYWDLGLNQRVIETDEDETTDIQSTFTNDIMNGRLFLLFYF